MKAKKGLDSVARGRQKNALGKIFVVCGVPFTDRLCPLYHWPKLFGLVVGAD